MPLTNTPKICVYVIVKNKDKILALFRNKQKTWSVPGGHLEFSETLEECAKREVKEETNVEIDNIKFIGLGNDIFPEYDLHYVMVWVSAEYKDGEIKNMEPDRCKEVKWVRLNSFPKPIFTPLKRFFDNKIYN